MASAINGRIRIAWRDLAQYSAPSSVPEGAQVEIDLSRIDDLPDRIAGPRGQRGLSARDRFDFLDSYDRDALRALAKTATRIDVVGDRPDRVASVVQFLRSAVGEMDGSPIGVPGGDGG